MNKPYQKHTFKNGLRLVTVPMKNTKAVTVLVLVGTGSKYETKEINGISHFLEHMFFKGTKKRPNTLTIAEPLDRIGGQYGAFTGREYTGYWAKAGGKHLDLVLDWVSDVFLNSKLDPKEIEREKGVILEEINMYLDTPMDYVTDLWTDVLYGNQPAGWRVLGEREIIKSLKRQHFLNYLRNHYSSQNTVIIIAGAIDKHLENKVQKYFKDIRIKESKQKGKTIDKQTKPQTLIYYKKTDQTHLCLGVRGYNIFHKDRYILDVLTVILGRGMSSRIWTDVRARQGLAYYVFSKDYQESDTGYFYTQAGIDNKRIDKAIQIIIKNYKLLKNKKVGQKELRKAKDYIKGRSILNMESSDDRAPFYGFQELLENKILTLDEKFAKIEAVTANDIQRVAQDIFRPEKLNLALIGPFKDKSKFEKLLKI